MLLLNNPLSKAFDGWNHVWLYFWVVDALHTFLLQFFFYYALYVCLHLSDLSPINLGFRLLITRPVIKGKKKRANYALVWNTSLMWFFVFLEVWWLCDTSSFLPILYVLHFLSELIFLSSYKLSHPTTYTRTCTRAYTRLHAPLIEWVISWS